MALKVLMLRKRLSDAKAKLEALRAKDAEFKTREAELETLISEAESEEEKAAVEHALEQYEADKTNHDKAAGDLETEIHGIEDELRAAESKAETPVDAERKDNKIMNTRKKFFGMAPQERDAFFANSDVRGFLQRVRDLARETRTVSGAELLIPTIVLDLLRENIQDYSKLYKHINVQRISGKARQTVMGTIPEAVWTEMCATLNELDLSFGGVEVDGYKVGGYIAICNAVLEDSDIDLASAIISALGQAIGLALDKAILYGTGTKMPLGIVPRLGQTAEPAESKSTVPWTDLHTTNLLAISGKTDAALFKALVEASSAAKSNYSRGTKFWAMNEKTYAALVTNSISISATGAIVSGVNATMPIIGGAIETLPFIPDNVIIGGYGDLYLLVERAGASFERSEHYKFVEDQTIFKGSARYDGRPVIADGFVAIAIGSAAPTADAVTFAPDRANTPA